MKKFFIAALLVTALAWYGCSKDGAEPSIAGMNGTFKYAGYAGGFAGLAFHPVDTIDSYLQIDTANARIMVYGGGVQACSDYTFEKSADGTYGFLTLKDSIMYTKRFTVSISTSNNALCLYPTDFMDAFDQYYKPSSQHFDWCNGSSSGNH